MNQDQRNSPAERDPLVSAEYRATATEHTPPTLDAMVLERAQAAVRTSGLGGFAAHWSRPLAFVATLVLSLALVLELTRTPEPRSVMDANFEAGRALPPAEDSPALRDSIPDKQPSPGESPAPASAKQMPESANRPMSDEAVSSGFAEIIESSAERMQEAERQFEQVTEFRASDVVARFCGEEQIADALKWWQCIRGLQEAGRHDDAEAELNLFNAAHPEFEPPGSP